MILITYIEEEYYKIVDKIIENVKKELLSASVRNGRFRTLHEAYGVIKEEFDELWNEIKTKRMDVELKKKKLNEEATQVSAMCIRLIYDFCRDLYE